MLKWIRSRTSKQTEPGGKQCTGCRTLIVGTSEEQLRASGGLLLAGVGWFCGPRCQGQYRLRFRIPADGSPRSSPTRSSTPATVEAASEQADPGRAPAVDELAAVLRERRRRLLNGQ